MHVTVDLFNHHAVNNVPRKSPRWDATLCDVHPYVPCIYARMHVREVFGLLIVFEAERGQSIQRLGGKNTPTEHKYSGPTVSTLKTSRCSFTISSIAPNILFSSGICTRWWSHRQPLSVLISYHTSLIPPRPAVQRTPSISRTHLAKNPVKRRVACTTRGDSWRVLISQLGNIILRAALL